MTLAPKTVMLRIRVLTCDFGGGHNSVPSMCRIKSTLEAWEPCTIWLLLASPIPSFVSPSLLYRGITLGILEQSIAHSRTDTKKMLYLHLFNSDLPPKELHSLWLASDASNHTWRPPCPQTQAEPVMAWWCFLSLAAIPAKCTNKPANAWPTEGSQGMTNNFNSALYSSRDYISRAIKIFMHSDPL